MRSLTAMLFSLLSLALIIPAVGPAAGGPIPGVTGDEIRVGSIIDMTGPAAFVGQEISAGIRLYFLHVNAQGGVHGRRLRLITEDDGYQPPRSIAAFRKLVDRDRVFCLLGDIGSSTNLAVFPFIERERIPLIAPACFNSALHDPPRRYVFTVDPSYDIQSWIIARYIVEAAQAEEPRLAILYQDDDYGRDGLKGLREAATYYQLPLVAEQSHRRGAVDFSTQVLNLTQADPTHVILATLPREAATVLKEAHRLNWHPRFLGLAPACVDKTVELAGDAAASLSGSQVIDLRGDPLPAQTTFYYELVEQHDSGRAHFSYHAHGFGSAQILVEGLRRAGPDLTREKLVEAMESLDGWSDSLLPPVTYGPGVRGGVRTAAFICKVDPQSGLLVRATDWIHFEKPDEHADAR